MKVSIGFSSPHKAMIGAKAISWWMGTKYSHIFIKFEYLESKAAIFHAANGQVHFRSETNFLKNNSIVEEFYTEVDQEEHDRLFDRCMDLSGQSYSFIQLIKILCSDLIYAIFKKAIYFGDSKGYICSELIGKLLVERFNFSFEKPIPSLKPIDIHIELIKDSKWHD
jgi:hypothetical protein